MRDPGGEHCSDGGETPGERYVVRKKLLLDDLSSVMVHKSTSRGLPVHCPYGRRSLGKVLLKAVEGEVHAVIEAFLAASSML